MSWIPNLALHRKLAARVRTSADGFGRADCADEFRKTVDAFKLILTRDGEDVGVLAWDVPLSQDGEELALPGVPSSVQLLDADIDSGTWTARIESLDGTYVAYTDSVGKSSADVVIADDIDVEHGISISGGLAMDDDLSTGGEPDPEPEPGETFFFFKPESPWNASIPLNATYHGPSHPVTAEIRKTTISGGSTLYAVNAQNYAINVYYASSGGPTKTVRIKDYWGRWDFNVTVPWPSGTHPAMGTDGHLSIHDPDGITTHEFWYLRDVGGGQMEASTYARVRKDGTGWNLFPEMEPGMIAPYSRNPAEATAGSGACRAVSVGLLGGLITKEDVDSGEINHALAMALPRAMLSRGPRVYPADATPSNYDGDSSSVGPIKYSMRFALPKSLNLDSLGLSSQWLMVARAFQNKGGYPVDVGGNGGREIMIYTQYPGAYSFGMALRERQSTDFRAIVQRLEYVEWY